ncbi:MAG: DUF305 domain-containing protein [Euzebyales bacterium]|jgi:uncharacterized protein (DUF305 family)|nr:DUF305 domain-containing protein [Euzebyales bacterium]
MHARTLPYRFILTALTVIAALLLTACGDTTATDAPDDIDLNDADVTFLEGMVPHHSQAVEMARIVPDRTDRPELNALAEQITTSQNEEIDTMRQLLTDAGERPAPTGMDGMDGMDQGGGGMAGMMDDSEMQSLMTAEGEEFDLMFIDMMIRHHEGAIESSQDVLADGQSPQVADLAEGIVAEQESEIEQMREWESQWS